MAWNRDNEQTLRQLWDEGKTASQIATEMGPDFSRNMVIGKARRMGLSPRPSPIKRGSAPI